VYHDIPIDVLCTTDQYENSVTFSTDNLYKIKHKVGGGNGHLRT